MDLRQSSFIAMIVAKIEILREYFIATRTRQTARVLIPVRSRNNWPKHNPMYTSNALRKITGVLLLLIGLSSAAPLQAQVKKSFEPRFSGTVQGDFTMIANNVLNDHPTNAFHGQEDNQDKSRVYVDIDGDQSTFNSSSADLTNPQPGVNCIEFTHAYIYWAASDKETGGSTQNDESWNYNQVKLKLPGTNSYSTITADEVLYRGRDEHFANDPYICMKDITDDIRALDAPYGTYQVANVKAAQGGLSPHGGGNYGVAGGWQIVFVYQSTEMMTKNITIFDGYAHVKNNAITNFEVDGFNTIPSGEVKADFLLGVIEGDRVLSGDKFEIEKPNGTWEKLSSPMRNANNFFNSRITKGGTDFLARNPASTNTLGFDASIFSLQNPNNSLIANNQTSTKFRATSGQESYGLFLVGLSIEVYEPSLGALDFVTTPSNSSYEAGDTATLSLTIENTGNDNAVDMSIRGTLPSEVEFAGAPSLPTGITYTYDAQSRELIFEVADGLTDVNDPAYTIDFNVEVQDACYFLEGSCTSSFELQLHATYTGEITGEEFSTLSSGTRNECGFGNHDASVIQINQPDMVGWGTETGSLDREINCGDTAALNNAMALEPVAASCDFDMVKVTGQFIPDPQCETNGTYTNTWTFTDACGRESTAFTQEIRVVDNVAPVFNETLPEDTVAAFDAIPSEDILTASDACDDAPVVNFNESYIGDTNSTSYVIVRTWTATDCAGNQVQHDQRIYVTENGDAMGLTINDVTIDESANQARFEIRLTGELQGGFTVDYTTMAGSAANVVDFTPLAPTSVYFEGQHGETKWVDVAIINDEVVEADEMFSVLLSNLTTTKFPINDDEGKATILDNDAAQVSINSTSVNEDAGNAVLELVLSGAVQEGFSLDFETSSADASAIPGLDYSSTNGTLQWPVNAQEGDTMTISIPIEDDLIIETTENFMVLLSNINGTGNLAFGNSQANVDIIDNDGGADYGVSFSTNAVTVDEAAGVAIFTVQMNGQLASGFTVNYQTYNANAEAGLDYEAASGQLNFSGTDGEKKYIEVAITDDNIIEATEEFTVVLSNLSTTLITLNGDTATGSITDNDGGNNTGISFDTADVSVNEDAGTATFEVVLNGNVQGGFSVDFQTFDASAEAGSDYEAASGTLNFDGINGEKKFIEVAITDDNIIEATEEFTVVLSNLSTTLITLNGDTATGNITDNDGGNNTGISFDTADVSVNEDAGTATFEVVLNGNVQGGFSVDFQTFDASAEAGSDYEAASGTLNFDGTNGEKKFIEVAITDDNIIEATEEFTVVLSNLSTTLITLNGDTATGNITDNDGGNNTGISFDTADVSVNEDAGTATFEVVLNGNVQGGFSVDFQTFDASAEAGSDYEAASGTLDFNGNNGEVKLIEVAITDDNIIEATEEFTVVLSNLSTTLITLNGDTATGSITDNDGGNNTGISFDTADVSVNEDAGTATFEVVLNGNVQGGFSVDFQTFDASAEAGSDYEAAAGTLNFDGTNGEKKFIEVAITDDNIIEATEDFTVVLSNLSTTLITLNGDTATGSITDNDGGNNTGISFDTADVSVNEDAGTAIFEVVLNGNVQGGFSVDFQTFDASAEAGSDYDAAAGTLNFDGNNGEVKLIEIAITDDNIIEATEEFTVVLSNLSTTLITLNGDTGTGSITDNDLIQGNGISFDQENITVDEATGNAVVDVVLSGAMAAPFSLQYTTVSGTALEGEDYEMKNGNLSFLGMDGEVQQIMIPIIDDELIEATELFTINLSGITTNLIAINTPQANVEIVDNDAIDGTGISFDQENITVDEAAGNAIIDVVLTGAMASPFSLQFTTASGSALEGEDYEMVQGNLNFLGVDGEVLQIKIPIIDDELIEATELFTINLSGITTNLIAINTPQANVEIIDNDAIDGTGISFDQENITVDEAAGNAIIDVILTGAMATPFSLQYTTASGSALEGVDYEGVSGSLDFTGADGEVQQVIIPIFDDKLIEDTELFKLTLDGLTTELIAINAPQAQIEILDNDAIAGTGLQLMDITVNEDAGTATFSVLLAGFTQDAFEVTYGTNQGSANEAMDFTAVSGTLQFEGFDGEVGLVTVPIIDDIAVEDDEDFFLSIASNKLFIPIMTPSAKGTIIDNDKENEASVITAECDNIPPAEDPLLVAKGCDVAVDFTETISGQDDECANEYRITREWIVTDCMGNQRTYTEVINVVDTTAPEFTSALPEDITVSCDAIPAADELTAIDNCDPDVSVNFNEEIVGEENCAFGYTIIRTWTATDCAGNATAHTQEITVESNGPITATNYEEEVTISCGDELPGTPEPNFNGGCGDYTISYNEYREDFDSSDDYMIIREWIVSDSCGNEERFEQVIMVVQPEEEIVFIDLCVEDMAIDLYQYLPSGMGTDGSFTITHGDAQLDGSYFDPQGLAVGLYKVAYEDTSGDCKYYVSFEIAVNSDCVPCRVENISPSKTVTANGDGVNDYFEIAGVEYCDFNFSVKIFNRWGAKVFEDDNYQNNWGGASPGSSFGNSGMLPTGTYYYIIEVSNREDMEPINGYIYLGTK